MLNVGFAIGFFRPQISLINADFLAELPAHKKGRAKNSPAFTTKLVWKGYFGNLSTSTSSTCKSP